MKRGVTLSNHSELCESHSKKQLDRKKMLEMRVKLHNAIWSKNTQLMQDILKNYNRNLDEVEDEYGLPLHPLEALTDADAIILAVPHTGLAKDAIELAGSPRTKIVVDIKGALDPSALPDHIQYWRL